MVRFCMIAVFPKIYFLRNTFAAEYMAAAASFHFKAGLFKQFAQIFKPDSFDYGIFVKFLNAIYA